MNAGFTKHIQLRKRNKIAFSSSKKPIDIRSRNEIRSNKKPQCQHCFKFFQMLQWDRLEAHEAQCENEEKGQESDRVRSSSVTTQLMSLSPNEEQFPEEKLQQDLIDAYMYEFNEYLYRCEISGIKFERMEQLQPEDQGPHGVFEPEYSPNWRRRENTNTVPQFPLQQLAQECMSMRPKIPAVFYTDAMVDENFFAVITGPNSTFSDKLQRDICEYF